MVPDTGCHALTRPPQTDVAQAGRAVTRTAATGFWKKKQDFSVFLTYSVWNWIISSLPVVPPSSFLGPAHPNSFTFSTVLTCRCVQGYNFFRA